MPKFLVARENVSGKVVVDTSIGNIKKKLKENPDTTWKVKTYVIKFDLPTVCKMLEDSTLATFDPVEEDTIRVLPTGRCMS